MEYITDIPFGFFFFEMFVLRDEKLENMENWKFQEELKVILIWFCVHTYLFAEIWTNQYVLR